MFRSIGNSKIAILLAILFGISLFFFRSGDRFSNFFNSDSVIAKVSSTQISSSKFNRTMQMNIDRFNQMLGKEMTGDEIRGFQVHSLALGALINDAVFEDEFDKINYKIDETVIAKKTKEKIPQIYDSNNKLNEIYLRNFLGQQQLQIEDIVQIISYETRDDYFNDAFFNVNFPKYFTKKISKYNNHKRNISFIELDIDKIKINKDSYNLKEELENFYNENISQYQSSEKRDVQYIVLDKNLLSKNFKPSDFDIKEYYNNNKNLFFEEEKRTFIQFNFKSKEDAVKFYNNNKSKRTDKILQISKEKNIKFNKFEKLRNDEVLEEISETLFKLKEKQISEVIETSFANHIILLDSIDKAYQKSLDEVSEEIRILITKIETENYYIDLSNQIGESILNGDTLEMISNSFDFKIESIKNLTFPYLDENINKSLLNNLIKFSFESNKDFVSDIIKIDENISFIFNVSNIDISKPIDFNKVENEVLTDWSKQERIKLFNNKIKENKDNKLYLKNLAMKYGVEIKTIAIDKDSTELPSSIVKNIFISPLNTNITNNYDNKFYIHNINNVKITKKEIKAEKISLLDDLRNSFGEEIIKTKKISTNENLLKALIERY